MLITQDQFEILKSLEKEFKEQNLSVSLEGQNNQITKWEHEVISLNNKETFILNYFRPKLEISKTKITFNARYRKIIRLIRIDLEGTHTNPNEFGGETFEGPHIHIYDEKFHDRVAYPLSKIFITQEEIKNVDIYSILKKFLDYFNTKYPNFTPKLEL
jgi:hypothetical protein